MLLGSMARQSWILDAGVTVFIALLIDEVLSRPWRSLHYSRFRGLRSYFFCCCFSCFSEDISVLL
jgi:hypothetical protein